MIASAPPRDAPADVWRAAANAALAPRPRLRPSEWCDRELVVTAGPLRGARWRTTPAQRGILDVFHLEPKIETVVVRAAAQTGKSAAALGLCGYHLAHRPTAQLYVLPTRDPMAYDWSRTRLEPMIRDSPALSAVMTAEHSRKAGTVTRVLLRTTRAGGQIAIAGANSAPSLATRSVEVLVQDEVDRWPARLGDEGSPVEISRARTDAYGADRMVLMLSSPTTDVGTVTVWYESGDQRQYFVPCPGCGVYHVLAWPSVEWTDDDPATAVHRCGECNHGMTEAERRRVLDDGEWRATAAAPDPTVASFQLSRLASPFTTLQDCARAWISARRKEKRGDRDAVNTFRNLWLGEPVPAQVEKVETAPLLARREPFEAAAPGGVAVLTAGCDVQADRLELLVVGWSATGEESWLLARSVLYGSPETAGPWDQLDVELAKTYRTPDGEDLTVRMCAVDSGYLPTTVYRYVAPRQPRGLRATIGRAGSYPLISSPSAARSDRPAALFRIGVDECKALWLSRLKLDAGAPDSVHLPAAPWCDEGFTKSLCSEALETRRVRGQDVRRWVVIHRRNEVLDCAVYALAMRRLVGAVKPGERRAPSPATRREGYLGDVRRDWLRA